MWSARDANPMSLISKPGETAPSAADCYQFALSHPNVDICMTGPKNLAQMRENLSVLERSAMTAEELERMRRIGDHIYGRPRATA